MLPRLDELPEVHFEVLNRQIDNGFFNRPFIAHTQIIVHRWGPRRIRIPALFHRRDKCVYLSANRFMMAWENGIQIPFPFLFSFSHDIEKQISVLLFVFVWLVFCIPPTAGVTA